MKTNTNFY